MLKIFFYRKGNIEIILKCRALLRISSQESLLLQNLFEIRAVALPHPSNPNVIKCEDDLKHKDDLKIEDVLKDENDDKNKDNCKNRDDPKNEGKLKNEDDPEIGDDLRI